MSEPNFEGNSDQTSEQAGSYPNHQSQKQNEEANSANNVESLGDESASEHLADEMALPFQSSSKPTPSDLPEQNLQGANETADSFEQQSIEVDLDQEISSASGDLVNQSSLIRGETLEQEPEIREQVESGETHAQGNHPFPESTVQGRQQSDEEFFAEQSSQLNNNLLERPSQPEPRPSSVPSPQLPNFAIPEETTARQSVHSPVPSKWAPLIYGRTYEIDFRFLVVPPDFDEHSKNQVWEFIKITTRSPENLSGKPRWIFLRTERHCIIGTTCLVRDLLNSREADAPEDLTRDRHGRPLYAFVGFVADTPVPSTIPAMNLEVFADPYRKLIPRIWRERYVRESRGVPQALSINYYKEFKPEERVTFNHNHPEISSDQLVPERQGAILFFNIEDAQNILYSASRSIQITRLFIGNLTIRELLDSDFMVAALDEIQSRTEVQKVQKTPLLRSPTPHHSQPQQDSRSLNSGRRNAHPPSGESPQHRRHEQHSSTDSGFDRIRNFPKDFIVGLSKLARSNIEFLGGEKAARDADEVMFKTLGQIGAIVLGERAVAEIYSEIANLDEFERRLITAINAVTVECDQLKVEYEQLMAQGRRYEAQRVAEEVDHLNEKLAHAGRKLSEITRLLTVRRSHASEEESAEHNEETVVDQRRDPYFGFKEKEKPVDELPSEPGDNVPKHQDPWQL